MKDYFVLGSAPTDEKCTQVGAENYYTKTIKELKVLIGQLRRQFGEEPFGAQLKIKSFPHDFGTYHEVICEFDDSIEESEEYALMLENHFPEKWDDIARQELSK